MSENKTAIQKTIYDNAKNHFLGNFPESLPIEQAYVHIGMFLGWMIDNELYSEYFEDESGAQIYRFKKKDVSCTILSEIWDGYLGYELFNKEGNMFAYYYYGGGIYRKDYEKSLCDSLPSIYHVKDTWENYNKMEVIITQRYKDWRELIS